MERNNINKVKSSTMKTFKNKLGLQLKTGLILILGLLFVAIDLNATHIVGGNLTYRKVGPNTFEITLELRRDCFLGSSEAEFDNPAAIGIFSSMGALQLGLGTNGAILIPYDASDTLNNIIISDCGFEGTQVCVEEFKYKQVVTLPRRSGGYILAYQRCCRNGSLNNVFEPLETGATYSVRIPELAFDSDNDSPSFNQWPPVYICANEAINFDHSAMDTDGDSLVYKLCVPRNGATKQFPKPQPPGPPPYQEITWQSPYDLTNLLGGVPLKIDSKTGQITGTPNSVGQFLVGVCVEEYRNGVFIGQVVRDFQYNVRVCSDPPTAVFDAPTENCDGLTIDFTNESISASQYFWNFDYPSTDSANFTTIENPTFTFPSSGTYDVFLRVVRGTDKCSDSIVKTINVFDAEFNVDFDVTLEECLGTDMVTYSFTDKSTINVPGVISQGWVWTVTQGTNTQTLNGNPATIDLLPGDYTIQLDVMASNGCAGSVIKSINYEDFVLQPDFDVAISGCTSNDSLRIRLDDFTAENNPDYIITDRAWTITFNNTTITASGDNAIVSIPRTNYTVKLIVTSNNGCIKDIQKDFLITNFIPTADFTFALSGCNGGNNPLIKLSELSNDTVQYSAALSYNWTLNGNVLVGDTVLYESINEDTILAILNVEFADGCFATTSQVIRIDEIRPQVNYTWQTEECPTDGEVSIILTFDTTKVYGYDYDQLVWSTGIATNVKSFTGNPITITVPKDSTAVVTLSTNFENGCSDEVDNSFYPGDFAQIILVADSIVLCPNEKAPLVVSSNPNLTYTWTPTIGLDLTDPSKPIVASNMDRTYTVVVSDGLCSVTDSIFVDVLEQIDLTIIGDDFTCNGDVALEATGAVGPGEYEWSNQIDFATIVATGPNLVDNFKGLSKTYYVRYKADICDANPSAITVVNQTPILDLITPFEMCINDTITYRITNENSIHIIDILWVPNPHILAGGNTLEPTITVLPTDNGSFELYYTAKNQFGCSITDTLVIEIAENPIVDFTYEVVDCDNYEVCFKVVGELNGFPIWDLGDTTTTDDRFLIKEVCYIYPGPGTYIVTLENASAICPFATVTKTITLNGSLPLFDLENLEICRDSIIEIPVPAGVVNLEFSWCDLQGNEISKTDPLVVTVTNSTAFILKVIDENGCPFSDTINVNSFDFDYILTTPTVYCAGEEVQASIEVKGADIIDFIYDWSPAACVVSGGNTANPILLITGDKTINVTVIHPGLGCVLTESFEVKVTELMITADSDPDTEIYQGDSVDIYVVDQMTGDTYEWSNGAKTGSQTVSPDETTTYSVTVTDENGCTGIASLTVIVIKPNCEEDVFLPNAFSPNGDNVNNVLYVRSNFIDDMMLIIYNRYNEEVFRSTDQANGWDGTFKGAQLSPDSYGYFLTATCVDGETIKRQGSINLLR